MGNEISSSSDDSSCSDEEYENEILIHSTNDLYIKLWKEEKAQKEKLKGELKKLKEEQNRVKAEKEKEEKRRNEELKNLEEIGDKVRDEPTPNIF